MSDIRGEQPGSGSQINGKQQLDSWKEIAAYVHRTVATVKRWEKKEGLPVHRHLHDKRSTVYAYPSEIDAWLTDRNIASRRIRFRFLSKNRRIVVAAVTGAVLLLLAPLVLDSQKREWSTSSPQALELFKKAEAFMIEGRSGQGPAEELLKQAIAKDPEFASAHIFLAWAIRNQGKPASEYMNHAERAVQLAETMSDRERYFIQGSYSGMKGEQQKALRFYKILLSLYPDHFWAINNLAALYREMGQEQEALEYVVRRADLRPSNFPYTYGAARRLIRAGDRARAKIYIQRVLDLVTPEDIDSEPDAIVRRMWFFSAFEALLNANPETALREANRSLERLRSFEEGRFVNGSPMGAFYLTLGKIQWAREWFEKSTEPGPRRQYFLAAIAYIEEDHRAMTAHLEQTLKDWESLRRMEDLVPTARGPLMATLPLLLARGGFGLPPLRAPNPNRPDFIQKEIPQRSDARRAMLAVIQDNSMEELRKLGDALSSMSFNTAASASTYFMGSEILAEAWRERGDLINAAQVLRTALEKDPFLVSQSVLTGALWLKLQAQLSQLYREMGQDEDALKIEDKLRRSLAYADPDHPILRQLDRTKELALLPPPK